MSGSKKIDLHLRGKVAKLKHVPKEYLQTTKIILSGTDSFLHVTYWIPKADIRYGRPRLAVSMSMGEDKLAIYFDSIMEFRQFVESLTGSFDDRSQGIADALQKAQNEHEFLNREYNKLLKQFE